MYLCISTENVWENTQIFHILRDLADFEFREPTQSPMSGNAQIPIKWKYSVESHFILRLWVFEEIRSYYETKIIHKVWVM